MYQHLIVTYSTYKHKSRVAYHECYEDLKDGKKFLIEFEKLKKQFKHQSFGFYQTSTEACTWQSVIEYDGFFSDVESVDTIRKFKDIILEDTELSPKEIAKAILFKKKVSPLKLQKLIYFLWVEHRKTTEDDLLKHYDFEAWRHGPVINDVYYEYASYGGSIIDLDFDSKDKFIFQSRLMKYPYYEQLTKSIEKILGEYGDKSAIWLSNKTHEVGSPWYTTFDEGCGQNRIIPKELIEDYYIKQ